MATNKRLIKSNDEAAGGASFNTVLYTGNNTGQSITGVGFQPDLVWIKTRDRGYPFTHRLTDSVRGATKQLNSDTQDDESIENGVLSFNSDGFTLGDSAGFNISPDNFVAWCWKAGGAAVTNTDGTITSQVSANTEAGFSIVSLTIPNANTQSVGHGLDTAPSVIIMKARDSAESWLTYHSSIGLNKYLLLNSTSGEASYTGIWSDVNSSTFTTVYHDAIGSPTRNVIAYCFAEVAGFSKFGSYVGNGNTGQTIVTGFEPAFLLIKASSVASSWFLWDNKRDTINPNTKRLIANTSQIENSDSVGPNFISNGFSFDNAGFNDSGITFIYMAFANQF